MLKGTGYDVQNGLAYNSSFLNSGRIGNFERERERYIYIYLYNMHTGWSLLLCIPSWIFLGRGETMSRLSCMFLANFGSFWLQLFIVQLDKASQFIRFGRHGAISFARGESLCGHGIWL